MAGKARQCRISVTTEHAILQAAKGLGFQASHVARSLRTQRTGLIGLLVPDASNPFFAAIARKATIFAERQGLSTLLADSHDSIEHERDLLTHLQSRQVEGLIVCPIGDSSSELRSLGRTGAKVVVVDRWFADIQLTDRDIGKRAGRLYRHRVQSSKRGIGGSAVCKAARARRPTTSGCLASPKHSKNTISSPMSDLIQGDDFSEASGYRSTCQLLDMYPDLSALFALSNQNALGALRAFAERKLKVPARHFPGDV